MVVLTPGIFMRKGVKPRENFGLQLLPAGGCAGDRDVLAGLARNRQRYLHSADLSGSATDY
jgi:hypothetical protein